MKEVQLRRHAEKGSDGLLSPAGESAAREMGRILPVFAKIISSDSERAIKTAELLIGKKPEVDSRAGFYMASQEKSDAINALATERGLTFLEAVQIYNDQEVNSGIQQKATELNELINGLFQAMSEGQKALIVSHDLSISPAMAQRGIKLESIDPLCGYSLFEDGTIKILR